MIRGGNTQADLIKWKETQPYNSTGTVGDKYCRNFMRRHGDKIGGKRGQKYSLGRTNCSTYVNFGDIYDHNIEEMEAAGVAVRREEYIWMDRSGCIVDESDALGYKVTHNLIHPDMCIIGDEVGGNLNMSGDGYIIVRGK